MNQVANDLKKDDKRDFVKIIRFLRTFITILIIFILSLSLFFVAYLYRSDSQLTTLILSVASSLLCISLIALTYEIINRRQTEIYFNELFNAALDRQDLRILSKLLVFLFKENNRLHEVVSEDHQSHLLKTIVGLRCGDQSMADEIVDGLVNKVLSFPKILKNRRHRIILNELPPNVYPQEIVDSYYKITIDMKYQYKLDKDCFRIGYVSDRDIFEEKIRDFDYEYIYLLSCPELANKIEEQIFSVIKVEVNGINLECSKQKKPQFPTIINYSHKRLKDLIGNDVSVHYVISTFMLKRNHKYFDKIHYPTKNSSTLFEFADTKIHSVSVRVFYVSAQKSIVRYFPPISPKSVEVSIDDWVFPESGQIFVWNYSIDKYNW